MARQRTCDHCDVVIEAVTALQAMVQEKRDLCTIVSAEDGRKGPDVRPGKRSLPLEPIETPNRLSVRMSRFGSGRHCGMHAVRRLIRLFDRERSRFFLEKEVERDDRLSSTLMKGRSAR